MEAKTFVYDGIEVVKTGRKAVRTLKSNKTDELVEIRPKDSPPDWRKWVRETELFEVEQYEKLGSETNE